MPRFTPLVLSSLLAVCALPLAQAQSTDAANPAAQPRNVLQLTAQGQVEVQQDMLNLSLSTTRDAADAASVQTQLRKVVDAALAQLKPQAQAQQMEVRSGQFSVHPRYGRDGKINGWRGRAEVLLRGRDFARITQAAGRVSDMSISGMYFELSPEQRERAQAEAQAQAIERFKARAAGIAKAFGFAGYTLREVSIMSEGDAMPAGAWGRAKGMAMAAEADAAEMAVPAEPGNSVVQVTVSGSVQAN